MSTRSALLLTLAVVAAAPSMRAEPDVPPAIDQILKRIRAADTGQLAVSEEDGRFLRVLIASTGARRVLEIGAASGYSAIWMGLGLRETGGRLTTIEYDPARAREAAENIRRAGLQDVVQVIAGDAFAAIPNVPGTFDLVFLDAWKPDYRKFFDLVFPRVEPGGLFLAHNVINKRHEMLDFLEAIAAHPQALNTTVSPGHEGISITYKRRRPLPVGRVGYGRAG
jgi:predicted O-methyltransferase YrrM